MATPLTRLEGKYEILEKIREGGMGSVYKVRHRLLEEVRVVKVMRPHLAEDEILQARFLREAKVAIKLRHRNLAHIYDFTMDESGYAYLVMEFIDGLNLQDMIKVLGRPGLGLVLEISKQCLDALGYLHRKRIIHRDVSPDNLLITRDDEGALQVKLIDLGIAKVSGGDDSLTSEGTFLGKVRYSSPEHFKTHEGSDVNAASDLYSFGVVFYEMLTGTYPIKGDSVASLISGHLMNAPLDFATSDPDGLVPDDLRTVVLKSLEKNPKDRFGSSASFAKALQPWLDQHPVNAGDFEAIFDIPTLTTHKIRTIKPGSTQSRIDQSFGLSTTPPPGDTSDGDAEFESSGTVETGGIKRTKTAKKSDSQQAQIRALLAGAGKLAEAEHFDEARMQLSSVLDLDAENTEATDLLVAVDEADVELQERRRDAVESIRLLIRADSFEQAGIQLQKAIQSLGRAEIFEDLRKETETAQQAHEARIKKVKDISQKAAKLMKKENFEEAVPLLRGGLDLEPGNRELISSLEEAEKGLEALLDARRRAKEIQDTAATVAGHIENRDVDQAERALALANKLYGNEEVFTDLADRLGQLRDGLLLEKVEALRDQARQKIANQDFAAAISILDDSIKLVPDTPETKELMEAARQGLRLEEEARIRQLEIKRQTAGIERLIQAGRLDAGLRNIASAIEEFGDFEEASDLREKIEEEISAKNEAIGQAQSLLDQALEQAGGDAFAEAVDTLDEARALQTDYPEIGVFVNDTETEVHRRIESHRRQMTIDNVIESVERQLEKGNAEEAQRELGVGRRLYGASDVLDELGAKIEARERELKSKEIRKLIKSAQKKKNSVEDTIADLEAALGFDPHCEEALRLLAKSRTAQNRAEIERLESECESGLATIDQLIADGETARALEVLNSVVTEVGELPSTKTLRQKLEALL